MSVELRANDSSSLMTTIYALSSGRPPAGIAVIRISGPQAFSTLEMLTGRFPPAERMLVVRKLFDHAGDLLDTAMVVRFASPNSSTGEDMVELHLHGGTAVVAAVMQVLAGCAETRLAKAGEFTRQAFDNRKLDLIGVEALYDTISAETEAQRKQAVFDTGGGLHKVVDRWRHILIAIRANLEATLDFADEDDVPTTIGSRDAELLKQLIADIEVVASDYRRGEQIRDALTVAITGPPNAGKSSLINVLARRDVAIVSPHAGTTRDVIEVKLDLDGVAVILLDTAGLRDSVDPVEMEGIRRGRDRAASADLIIALGHVPPVGGLRVDSFSDLRHDPGWRDGVLSLSTITLDGVDLLLDWLTAWAHRTVRPGESVLISRARHVDALRQALAEVGMIESVDDTVLVAEHLRQATIALDSIIGRVGAEDILDAIFAGFCIGK